jgi:putative transposase
MAKIIPSTEHFQHFLRDREESFWGDVYGPTKLAWQGFLELESQRQRDRFSGWGRYERRTGKRRRHYRNGYYERDFVTRFGTIRLRVARTREKSFLPRGIERFQRRAEEVSMLIREAFLRGISTRAVGRVVALLTEEVVSATTVSKLTRDLQSAVRAYHEARLSDDYAYLFLDGVSLRVRRSAGRKRVQRLVAYGVRRDGTRHLLAFLRRQGESQADGEGLLQDLYRRGLEGKQLGLIVTDGCPGLAAAIPTVYPRVRHQRCWVHKMRNLLEKVRRRDYDEVKAGAQAMYLAESRAQAEQTFRRFRARWRGEYGAMVRRLERDLPELLSFYAFPRPLWRKLRTTNVIERCFVECGGEPAPWSALST